MKHLFYVHSHITFLVSKQYVFDQGINPDDCLFWCVRNYSLPLEYDDVFKNVVSYPMDVFTSPPYKAYRGINIAQNRKNIKIVEKIINNFFNGNDFYFYVPNTGMVISSIIATMQTCCGYYILEEGTANYMALNELPQVFDKRQRIFYPLAKFLFRRFFILRETVLTTSYRKFIGFVTILPQAFSRFSGSKHIVSNPFTKERLDCKPDALLSIDASLIIYCGINTASYIYKKLEQLFLNKGYSVIAYKFHPEYYKDEQLLNDFRALLQQCFSKFTIIELPKESVIENILNNYHCDFYSDWSSIALYSTLYNNTCYSYAQWIIQLNKYPKYHEAFQKCPSINNKSYTYL